MKMEDVKQWEHTMKKELESIKKKVLRSLAKKILCTYCERPSTD